MPTFEEQLDELVALASNAGRLGAEAAAAEKARVAALDRRGAGSRARTVREEWQRAEQKLAGAHRRFLARHTQGSQ